MVDLSQTELSEICNHLREEFPKNITRIYGGNIHTAWKIDFLEYSIFVKKNMRQKRLLEFEAHCLNNLIKYINPKNLISPKVLGYLLINNNELLLLEWIDFKNNNQKKLGQGLAEMHLRSHKDNPTRYGYSIQGFIGESNQINGWDSKWSNCYIKFRLEPQLNSLKINYIDFNKLKKKIEKVLLDHQPMNSLVHGDLWAGNVGTGYLGKGVIFDPACWWADCEVDIAMTRLFGGFNDEFYEEYYKVLPIKEGFEERCTIYNLYHVVNHANMFGGLYLNQVNEYIQRIMDF